MYSDDHVHGNKYVLDGITAQNLTEYASAYSSTNAIGAMPEEINGFDNRLDKIEPATFPLRYQR